MTTKSIRERARELESWVEDAFVESNGIVYTYLDARTGGPLTEASFPPDQNPMRLPGTEAYTHSEWHNYENCGMTTGAYLQALLCRHEVEADADVLRRARRCFGGIKYVYDIGKQLEEGFFPKIYGNRFSEQTSTDQVLYAMLALDHFHQHATPAEKSEIDRMIANMIGFWVKRQYRYRYFWHADMLWPLGRFPSLLLMGYKHGGDEIFKKEYDRLLAEGVNNEATELQLAPKLRGEHPPIAYETKHQAWLIGEMDGAVAMDVMELDYLLRNDPANAWASNWKKSIKKIFDEAKLMLAPDGTSYVHMLVDMKTLEPRRPEPELFAEAKSADDWIGFRFAAGARAGDSTLIARAAVQAEIHLHDAEMRQTARHIVRSLDKELLHSYHDPDRYPPEIRYRTNFYSGDGTCNWLWAYWQGRRDGVFAEHE